MNILKSGWEFKGWVVEVLYFF